MFRRSFWIWLIVLLITWGLALFYTYGSFTDTPTSSIFYSALFFGAYFLIPLFRKNLVLLALALMFNSLLVLLVFSETGLETANFYSIIIFSYLAGEAVYRLSRLFAILTCSVIGVSFFILGMGQFPIPFLILYIAVFGLAITTFHKIYRNLEETEARYEALLHEYRTMKRKSLSDEKLARQEERTQIGREIHDSVGHKLTNLLMQLEVARMEVDGDSKERLGLLKDLAKESLEETRRAVKAMKQEEIGGLSSIINLIRKLEAENFIRIHFSVKNRAFSAKLNANQTIAVYRAIQEALTNVMRHSPVREASVTFESPGESIFRFEVSNPVDTDFNFIEGYGLTAMRERIEQSGGTLEIISYQSRFVIRGTFPLNRKEDAAHEESVVS